MATDGTKTTETTDSTSEDLREEAAETEQSRAPSPGKADAAEKADAARKTETTDEAGNTGTSGTSGAAESPDDRDAADVSGTADEADEDVSDVSAGTAPAGGFLVGAGAVVSAGLGLCSLTGTSLGEMLRSRKELIGQIEAGTGGGGGGDQIDAFYSAPWHTAAVLNGLFALAAVLIGGVLLALHARRADTRPWVKAVALGGLVLGAIGLLVATGMYFDLFASAPELPGAPS